MINLRAYILEVVLHPKNIAADLQLSNLTIPDCDATLSPRASPRILCLSTPDFLQRLQRAMAATHNSCNTLRPQCTAAAMHNGCNAQRLQHTTAAMHNDCNARRTQRAAASVITTLVSGVLSHQYGYMKGNPCCFGTVQLKVTTEHSLEDALQF